MTSAFLKRPSAGVFRTVLMAAFLCAIIPRVVRAQSDPAPAATQSVSSSASHTSPGSAESQKPASEQDEENIYRHAPIVRWFARTLHMETETTARLFEYFNFAVIVLALGIPLARIVPRLLHARSRTLQDNLLSARKMTEEARTRLSAVEARLARLDEEIAQIRTQAEEESRGDEARIKASIGEESARIVAAAEQELVAAAAQARRGLRTFAADLAIEHASRQLVLTPETDQALIDEFVRDAARRGQN